MIQSCLAGTLIRKELKITDIAQDSRMYYDVKTNHKYIENNDKTYSEFTKKGVLFKIIQAGSRQLKDHPYIRPISNNTMLLYKKRNTAGDPDYRCCVQISHILKDGAWKRRFIRWSN